MSRLLTWSRRTFFGVVAGFGLTAVGLAGAVTLAACGGEDGGETTTGDRVVLQGEVVADDGITAPFTNAKGWSVQLSTAWISVGEFYFWDGAPIFSQLEVTPPATPLDGMQELLGLRTANAHPGHYASGNARGQMLGYAVVDLTQPSTPLPEGNGITGPYRSATFNWKDPATGAGAENLGGAMILIEGTATKDTMTRVFRMKATVEDTLDSYMLPKIDGCKFEEAEVVGDGTVTLHILPSVWLDQADFEFVAESPDGEPVELMEGEDAQRAFERGVKKGTAYIFSFKPL
jgi:hypothetical protein